MTERRLRWLAVGALALLAYLPALTAAPGRMPADSKLYLYLDPGRFLADAAGSFDPRQFAGWVPHQHIGYLWPSGPWFWLFDLFRFPDWIAHRLWIGTVLLAAGLGARACARRFGLGQAAALTAGVAYQTSLFMLPYVSRTSVLLLPWAGLGWIVALTIRASRRNGWADPAAIALIVMTVGSVNATALVMIAPAPALLLVHEATRRTIAWRHAAMVAGKTALLSLGVSLWWIAMLVIQGRSGTDVLPYSESLRDVSFTATSPEVWRGLGYWLFYVRDPFAATTTESLRYLSSTPAILVSFAIPVAALAGLVWVRWEYRRFCASLVVVGFFLAVGVHPIDDRAPLVALVTGDGEGGLALALRSSTRALPMLALGLALGLGALVTAIASVRPSNVERQQRTRRIGAGFVMLLCVANLPALWTGAFVDPALERDADPPQAWLDGAAWLDDNIADGRVLQLPGAEFGAYRWGYTVDQPLPGLTDVPVITRDLLPLGSPAAMDLVDALDDRAQDGVLEPESIAPIARLLGADAIWLTNDHQHERFRTARPEIVRDLVVDAPGIGPPVAFGAPGLNNPDVPNTDGRAIGDPRVGAPVIPVELVDVEPSRGIVRAADVAIAVSGSGDGLVDAAAAGLLPEEAVVRYTASHDDPAEPIAESDALIVTDSNRAQARHWRSSQDTRGFTEHADPTQARSLPEYDVLADVAGDERLPLFAGRTDDSLDHQTTAAQVGGVAAAATSYGEPFAYLPEHRPAMAVDGDPGTAWLVGEHGDPIGAQLVLTGAIAELVVRQPDADGGRRITQVGVTVRDPDGRISPLGSVMLDERSVTGSGQPVDLGLDVPAAGVTITIEAVGGGTPFTASAVAGVGFSEISTAPDREQTSEWIRPPHDGLRSIGPETPLAMVFTRWRVDPMDRWRSDPEPVLRRAIDLPAARTFAPEATVRIDARTPDAELADLFGWPVVASNRLLGSIRSAGVSAFDDDPSTSWITAFDRTVGAVIRVEGATEPIASLRVRQPIGGFSRVTSLTIRSGGDERTVELTPDASGAATATLDPPLEPGTVEFEVATVDRRTTVDRRFGDVFELPAAISSIEFAGAPSVESLASADRTFDCVPVADIDGSTVTATVRIQGDDWLDGGALSSETCSGPITLDAGRHAISSDVIESPFQLDRLVLDGGARDALANGSVAPPAADVVEQSRFERRIEVTGCPDGCWLVVGEGYNEAWSASTAAGDLGTPQLVDGGFNGWWIDGGDRIVVDVRWTAQRPLTLAMLGSVLVALAALALIVRDRLRTAAPLCEATPSSALTWTWAGTPSPRPSTKRATLLVATWTLASVALIAPAWGLIGFGVGTTVVIARRQRLAELIAVSTVAATGAAVLFLERRDAPLPDGGWPATFEGVHRIGVFAAVALLVAALTADDAQPTPPSEPLDRLPETDGADQYARPT